MARTSAGITGVEIGVEDAVEGHGDGARGDHGDYDPEDAPAKTLNGKSHVAPGEQRAGERERKREDRMLELDHFERQPDSPEEGAQETKLAY
jgi:hypothetical protein